MHKDMWELLKKNITDKVKKPTFNSKNLVKHAEEIARKQAMLDVLSEMEEIEKMYASRQKEDKKYSL